MPFIWLRASIDVKDSGDNLVEGFMEPLGLTLRGRDRSELRRLADRALDAFMLSYQG